jgi:hypothetical protein
MFLDPDLHDKVERPDGIRHRPRSFALHGGHDELIAAVRPLGIFSEPGQSRFIAIMLGLSLTTAQVYCSKPTGPLTERH